MNTQSDNQTDLSAMNRTIVITPHVINTLRALPLQERLKVASALTGEILLGDSVDGLEPIEDMIYSIIRSYINRDSSRYNSIIASRS